MHLIYVHGSWQTQGPLNRHAGKHLLFPALPRTSGPPAATPELEDRERHVDGALRERPRVGPVLSARAKAFQSIPCGNKPRFNPSAISRAPGHSQFGAVPDTRVRVLGEYLILLLSGEEEGWKCGVSASVYYLTS